jgi:intracellular sulfur oxidation DsrE/DsrF family protein
MLSGHDEQRCAENGRVWAVDEYEMNVDIAMKRLELAPCGNTVTPQNISLKDLLPGFVSAEKGGVVRLAELQSQGYLYLRP